MPAGRSGQPDLEPVSAGSPENGELAIGGRLSSPPVQCLRHLPRPDVDADLAALAGAVTGEHDTAVSVPADVVPPEIVSEPLPKENAPRCRPYLKGALRRECDSTSILVVDADRLSGSGCVASGHDGEQSAYRPRSFPSLHVPNAPQHAPVGRQCELTIGVRSADVLGRREHAPVGRPAVDSARRAYVNRRLPGSHDPGSVGRSHSEASSVRLPDKSRNGR
jgi:hypothetical protein